MKFNTNMTPVEIACSSPAMKELSKWFLTGRQDPAYLLEKPFSVFGETGKYIVSALNKLESEMNRGEKCLYDLYSEQEIQQDPPRAETQLIYFRNTPNQPFAVICAGGAYTSVCSLWEGMGTAYALNERGYNAFVLAYRVNQSAPDALLPKPIDDLAKSIETILTSDLFPVFRDNYAVIGFSAGGHLAAEWGTLNHGSRHYGFPNPKAIFLAYAATSTDTFYDDMQKSECSELNMEIGRSYLTQIGGEGWTRESLQEYGIENQVDPAYPPTYIVHCKDDNSVNFQGAVLLAQTLERKQVPHLFKPVDRGGHGFCLGLHMDAAGWLDEAVKFWKDMILTNR
jgi:acetyl esterase/lipase